MRINWRTAKPGTVEVSNGSNGNRQQRLLKISALLNSLVAWLLVAGTAVVSAKLSVSPGYIVQTLAVFTGLLFVLAPFLPQHLPLTRFGPANQVTLLRAGIAALMAGLVGGADPGIGTGRVDGRSRGPGDVAGWSRRLAGAARRLGKPVWRTV